MIPNYSKEIGPSASGKTTLLASSGGNIEVPNAEGVKVGLNVYRKRPRGHGTRYHPSSFFFSPAE